MNEFFHMEPHLFPVTSLVHSILLFFFILTSIPLAHSAEDVLLIQECNRTYSCGKIGEIKYPFWSSDRPKFCGQEEFGLTQCKEGDYPYLAIKNQLFRVLHINATNRTMTIARADLFDGTICPPKLINVTLDGSPFRPDRNTTSLHIYYGCPFELSKKALNNFNCSINGGGELFGAFYRDKSFPSDLLTNLTRCNTTINVLVPFNVEKELREGKMKLLDALKGGFGVDFNVNSNCSACKRSGGICGSNPREPKQFVCLCRDKPHPLFCPKIGKKRLGLKLGLGISAAVAGLVLVFIMIYCIINKGILDFAVIFKMEAKNDRQVDAFIRNFGTDAPKRYSYWDIKKMTNSFRDKLGQGGFGCVYKGKLCNGRIVAVKVLNEAKDNGEEFINEVASISRTSHVNVVNLLGFCYEKTKRALIYEFMPNGSLDRFIYDEGLLDSNLKLELKTLYEITVGVARGLEYLHRGCNTRILHFDIKPHNILLDEDFCPKISDFGLAKLCKRKESIISMLGMRGTIGYIAPEVFSRLFGEVSYKSDVYSYGMMILEIVMGRETIEVGSSQNSELYFPNWIYKHLEPGAELRLHRVRTEEEEELARKMILVGLWCIQTLPSDRPSMTKVVEMLEGSTRSLQIPPKPILSSSTMPQHHSCTMSMLSSSLI